VNTHEDRRQLFLTGEFQLLNEEGMRETKIKTGTPQ
jgi:hypothetical protein